MQVPLSRDYEPLIPQDRRYTLRDAVTQLEQLKIKVGDRGWEGREFHCWGKRGTCDAREGEWEESISPPTHAPPVPLPSRGLQVGMVLDLTNSSRYYSFEEELSEEERRRIFYCKVCRPRGVRTGRDVSSRRVRNALDCGREVFPPRLPRPPFPGPACACVCLHMHAPR